MKTKSSSSSSQQPPPLSSDARGKRLGTPPSKARGKRIQYPVDDIDQISNLPDEILENILSKLPLRYAVKTSILSKRWVHLWKRRLHLCVDMSLIMLISPSRLAPSVSKCFAESMSKTINNHRGGLESCKIRHYVTQCEDGTLERWIQTVTRVKHTKELFLENYIGCNGYNTLQLSAKAFSHRSLTSLSLNRYILTENKAFNSCSNLKTLKLYDISVTVSLLSKVLASCPSLEVLVLQLTSMNMRDRLKIANKNLEFLQVTCSTPINTMEVHAARLEVLDINYIVCEREKFILEAPQIPFNRNYWRGANFPHICYNISSLTQEKKVIWFELMLSPFYHMRRTGSLSVRVDAKNPKEVEILKEVLLFWRVEMKELEIIFKNNTDDLRGEGYEYSIIGDDQPFPDAFFRVSTIWMYNFNCSSADQFALASCFVTQGTMINSLMIETSAYPPTKKFMTEAKVAMLMELPRGNDDFKIECF